MRLRATVSVGFGTLLAVCWSLAPPLPETACGQSNSATELRSDAESEFFESRIRPVLVEHCYECHSAEAETPAGGLRLDYRDGMREGGQSGPAVIPGNTAESLLLSAIRYESFEMPPAGRLPESVIRDFEHWIASGARDPREMPAGRAAAAQEYDYAEASRHWAFQPLARPALPPVRDSAWPASTVDHFILSKLEDSGLSPSARADRRTLIRRAYFDLLGVPPTWEEVETFIEDRRPDAFERLVDRLLASPHYGERWGRHWLDVARYADTKDLVLVFGDDRIRPYAYTYRNYVVRAFNEDVPYDRFIHDQLAADQQPDVEPWRLAAMGLLTVGRLFDNNPSDIYDDQIDTVTRGFLGLTVSCARCHDHKYDAIPQADYYSLYGIFASSEQPLERPLIADRFQTAGFEEFEAQAEPIRKQLREHLAGQRSEILQAAIDRVDDYLVKIATEKPDPLETAIFFLSLSPDDLRPQFLGKWRRLLQRRATSSDPVFAPWQALMALPADQFSDRAAKVLQAFQARPQGTSDGEINPLVLEALTAEPLQSRGDAARRYGELITATHRAWHSWPGDADAEPGAAERQLLELVEGRESPLFFPTAHTYLYMSRVPRGQYHGFQAQLEKLAVQSPSAPPRAMSLVDSAVPYEPRIFRRGNPNQPGERVPRQFLRILSGEDRTPFGQGSGRKELAAAITNRSNPLTARVMVNRVWMHHFGEPLVATPSDFGVRSDPPTHPELLDWLSWTFREDGWSLKRLHRRILLSATWQQSSFDRPECRRIDPENRLLWRAHRRRLDLEAMRDAMLHVAGRLDAQLFGRWTNAAGDPEDCRRTVYGLVDRQDVPGVYRAFDFASPDQSAAKRPRTIVPQQALFAMNSPFMLTQTRQLAARFDASDETERVRELYRTVLTRDPSPAEFELASEFLHDASAEGSSPAASETALLGPWEQFVQVLLLTNELMFVE